MMWSATNGIDFKADCYAQHGGSVTRLTMVICLDGTSDELAARGREWRDMEELALRLSGVNRREEDTSDLSKAVSPEHTPLKELHDVINAVYKLINDTSKKVDECSVRLERGSLILATELPVETALYVNQVSHSALFPDEPYHKFLSALDRISKNSGLDVDLSLGGRHVAHITKDVRADYSLREFTWLSTEIILEGMVINMGGKKPNIHLVTDTHGEVVISIDKNSIQDIKPYHTYHINVEAEQAWEDESKIRNVRFVSKYDAPQSINLDEFISREKDNWDGVDSLEFVRSMRGKVNENN